MVRATARRRVTRWAIVTVLASGGATLAWGPASAGTTPEGSAPVGVTLEPDRQTITSALRVDLTRDFATLPLYKGTANDETVWYVITDVSDANIALELGINHASKLSNAPSMCPACVQEVETSDPLLGAAPVNFQGAPDFSPVRTVQPGPAPTTFPPQTFTVGAQGGANYSPFVRVGDSDVVFNAPIVATGDGPFDVTTHTNTHDRTLGIDTEAMTTDHLFVRGFGNGRSIAYLSFESSDAFTATLERSTFVPALADLQFQNGGDGPGRDDRADSARASIFTFVNATTGLEDAPPETGASQGPGRSQGLTHALSLPIVGQDAAVANPEVLEALFSGGDVSNIFSDMPRDIGNSDQSEYSPAWDLQVGIYSDAAVASGQNGLKTDAEVVLGLAAEGVVTGPGGLPMGSANIIINCPALAFLDESAGADDAAVPSGGVDAGSGGQASGNGTTLPVPPVVLLVVGVGLAAVAGRRLVRR